MKKISTIFSLILSVSVISAATLAQGQMNDNRRRGEAQRDHDNRDRDQNDRNDNNDRDHWDNRDNYHNRGDRNRYERSYNRGYQYGRNNNRRAVVVHHVYKRPRYIYYRDYDVYYDCRNNAYISHNGRNWAVSPMAPRMFQQVNWRNARSYEVDYFDDDFPRYLERRRPSIGQEYRGY
jgi:hypothetical protein